MLMLLVLQHHCASEYNGGGGEKESTIKLHIAHPWAQISDTVPQYVDAPESEFLPVVQSWFFTDHTFKITGFCTPETNIHTYIHT